MSVSLRGRPLIVDPGTYRYAGGELGPNALAGSEVHNTPNFERRSHGERGRGEHHLRQFTPPDLALAERYFESAMALDSTYAPVYLGLASVWAGR